MMDGFVPWMLCAVGVVGALRGLPLLEAAFRDREHPEAALRMIRGARWFIAAVAAATLAAGIVSESTGIILFGAAFLAEELYETTVALWILKWGRSRGLI
jgi:hypothetical protein